MGKGYIFLLMGFHMHTCTHTSSHTCVEYRFWTPMHMWKVSLSKICHCCPLCPIEVLENMHTMYCYECPVMMHFFFIFSRLCDTGVHCFVYCFLPHVHQQTPLCINRRRVSARERPKTKEKSHLNA